MSLLFIDLVKSYPLATLSQTEPMCEVTRILKMNGVLGGSTKFKLDVIQGGSVWRRRNLIGLWNNCS